MAQNKQLNASDVRELCAKSRRLRREGDLAQALANASAAAFSAPDYFAGHLEVARTMSKTGDCPVEAVAAWTYCIETFPNKIQLSWLQALLAAKRVMWGRLTNRTDVEVLEQEVAVLHQMARDLWPAADGDNTDNPDNQGDQVTQWILLSRADFISAAYRKSPDLEENIVGNQRAVAAWKAYFNLCRDTAAPISYFRYLLALIASNPKELNQETQTVISDAYERWPTDANGYAQTAEGADFYLRFGRLLLGQGNIDAAIAELAKVPVDMALSESARELEQMAQSFSISSMYQELTVTPQSWFAQDDLLMTWEHEGGSDKVVFVFAGRGLLAFLTFAGLHADLKKMGCHIVYLVDRHTGFFLNSKRWPTTIALVDELQAIASNLGATKIYTLGHSSGGYAALRFGAELDAERVLAFSPLVTPATTSWPSTRSFFKSICDRDPTFVPNIDELYRSRATLPDITVVYGSGSDRDRVGAESIREFDTVNLHPLEGCHVHGALTWVSANGGIAPFLATLFAETS